MPSSPSFAPDKGEMFNPRQIAAIAAIIGEMPAGQRHVVAWQFAGKLHGMSESFNPDRFLMAGEGLI